ncbi:MAG TPA: hypothetical protein VGZ32_03550 [Actinocrinis sp.]|uniref:hypothetical protein n=1 Tax=Actinocrinis sp. TaxID=1920516 RepID=UPI002DDCC7D5|nr:hypothetical protein [Actinocrinis sp.]HEV3169382.1 hypothetical protein [Actinocrinis sp.]
MVVRIGPGPEPGWLVVAVGAGMAVVGWYQISGQPTEAQQLPYLASATIPGSALIIVGSMMILARRMAGWAGRGGDAYGTTRQGAAAYGVAGGSGRDGASSGRGGDDGRLWGLPGGNYVHRSDCPLIDGKPEAFELTKEAVADGSAPRRACPICDPDLAALGVSSEAEPVASGSTEPNERG